MFLVLNPIRTLDVLFGDQLDRIAIRTSSVQSSALLGENVRMSSQPKYARIERERRFLLDGFPKKADVIRIRRITDHYIDGTSLRLRKQSEYDGPTVFKLTQKIPAPGPGAQQGLITNIYIDENEFRILAQLSASQLTKTRHSVPPFGIDVFEGDLEGLILAEIEFASTLDADALRIPSFVVREVSTDNRFTGDRLVRASRQEIRAWLQESGIRI
jgi:CYTH domain-containing protein